MASRRLPKHLRNVLGAEVEDRLVTILDEICADNAGARAVFSDFRRDEFGEFRREMNARFDRVDTGFAGLEAKVADVKADLMKWSFGFWVGAVIAVAAMAKLIR
jgi:hypothetical protein